MWKQTEAGTSNVLFRALGRLTCAFYWKGQCDPMRVSPVGLTSDKSLKTVNSASYSALVPSKKYQHFRILKMRSYAQ